MLEAGTVACHEGVDAELWHVLDALLHFFHNLEGLLQIGAGRSLNVDENGSHILAGYKSGLRGLHQQRKTCDGNNDHGHRQPAVAEEHFHGSFVFSDQPLEGCIEGHVETAGERKLVTVLSMGCHDEGTEGRTQRQCVDARNGHGNGHRQSELRIEFTRHTTQETDGNEYGHKHQGGGDQCRGNAMHGAYRCLIRVLFSVIELRLNSFHHDDGIINDCSDDEHEGKEREHVERETDGIDEGESAHE